MGEKEPRKNKIDIFNERIETLRSQYKSDKEGFLSSLNKPEPMLMAVSEPQIPQLKSTFKDTFVNNEEMINNFNNSKQ